MDPNSFMNDLLYKGKIVVNEKLSQFERVLYVYKSETATHFKYNDEAQLNWLFPSHCLKTIGVLVRGFEFTFPNLLGPLNTFLEPLQNLINSETGREEMSSVPTQANFFPEQKTIEDSIKNYKNIPIKYYINEIYFLHDKSNLIKETYLTAINIKLSIYGSISYFNKKTEDEIFQLISSEDSVKLLVKEDTIKNSLSFQLTNISSSIPILKDKKIHNLSLTRLGRKKKLPMQEPIETVIRCVQQSFEVAGGLNPLQIEIEFLIC